MTIDDIYKYVTTNGFHITQGALGNADFGTDYYSAGIEYACFHDGEWDEEFVKQTSDAAKQFYSRDFGDAGKYYNIIPFKEYGCYPSKYGPIWIKRNVLYTVIYFPFED